MSRRLDNRKQITDNRAILFNISIIIFIIANIKKSGFLADKIDNYFQPEVLALSIVFAQDLNIYSLAIAQSSWK